MDASNRISTALRKAIAQAKLPSDYFTPIEDVEPCPVVLWARESTRQQDAAGHLNWQRTLYRNKLREMGFTFLRSYCEIGSGWRRYRPTLVEACSHARRNGAVLATEAVNRLLRPDRYHSVYNVDADYEYDELEWITNITKGLTVATFFHPDMPEREVHGHQIQRGLMKPAPRGETKAKNEALRQSVLAMFAEGYSQAEIKRRTGLPSSNISRWIGS